MTNRNRTDNPKATVAEYTVRRVELAGREVWVVGWNGGIETAGSAKEALGIVRAREIKRKGGFKVGVIEWDNVPAGFKPPAEN